MNDPLLQLGPFNLEIHFQSLNFYQLTIALFSKLIITELFILKSL